MHYPLLGAAGYAGLAVWHGGFSASTPLLVATEGHFLADEIGIIPVGQTLFSPLNIVVALFLIIGLPYLFRLLSPLNENETISVDKVLPNIDEFLTEKEEDSKQQVRDTVMLPHGTGKSVKILVFAEGDAAREATSAGADYIVDDELMKKIQDGWMDFDAAVSTTDMMGKVGRLGKVLGPRGLMPNPKAGTVVPPEDITRVINELKAGRVEFRVDRTANLHVPIGKVSFQTDQLLENMTALMEAVKKSRPSTSKGAFIKKIVVTATMGPGIHIDPSSALALAG